MSFGHLWSQTKIYFNVRTLIVLDYLKVLDDFSHAMLYINIDFMYKTGILQIHNMAKVM